MAFGNRVELSFEEGDPVTVLYDARDLRAWEVEYGKSALVEDTSVGMLTYCAWHAAQRQGMLNGRFPTYVEVDRTCIAIKVIPEDRPKPRPRTSRGRSAG